MAQKLGEAYVELIARDAGLRKYLMLAQKQTLAVTTAQQGMWDQVVASAKKASHLSTMLWMGVIMAAGAAGTVGYQAATQMENGQKQLQGALGLTTQKTKEATQAARNLWLQGYGKNLEDVFNRLTLIGQTMGDFSHRSQADIEKLGMTIMQMADTFGVADEQIAAAFKTMKANFPKASDTQVFDQITYALQHGGKNAQDFLSAVEKFAPQFARLGFSADQFSAILHAGLIKGQFDIEQMGQAIQTLQHNIFNSSKQVQKAIEDGLGLSFEKVRAQMQQGGPAAQQAFDQIITKLLQVKDKGEQARIGAKLFGDEWTKLGPKAFASLLQVQKGVDAAKGSTDQLINQQNTFSEQITILGRQIQDVLGNWVGPALDNLKPTIDSISQSLQKAADASKQFADVWRNSGSFMKAFTTAFSPETQYTIAGIAGAIGGGLMPKVVTLINTLMRDLPKVIPHIRAMVAAFGEWTIIGAAVAIVALWIYRNWDSISAKLKAAWQAFTNWFAQNWENIKKTVLVFEPIFYPILLLAENIYNNWGTYWPKIQAILSQFGGVANLVFQAVLQLLTWTQEGLWWLWKTVFQVVGFVLSAFFALGAGIYDGIASAVNWLINELPADLQATWNAIVAAAQAAWNWFYQVIVQPVVRVVNDVIHWFQNLWNGIVNIYSGIVQAVINFWNNLVHAVMGYVHQVVNGVLNAWHNAQSALANIWSGIQSVAGRIWHGVVSVIVGAVNHIIGALNGFIAAAERALSGSVTIPMVGTVSWGVHLPRIPYLAKGGIVTAPTLAMVGEGRSPEAVLPLNEKTYGELAKGIAGKLGGAGTTINVYPQKATINERDLANIWRRMEWVYHV